MYDILSQFEMDEEVILSQTVQRFELADAEDNNNYRVIVFCNYTIEYRTEATGLGERAPTWSGNRMKKRLEINEEIPPNWD